MRIVYLLAISAIFAGTSVSDVAERYENGNPKIVNSYQEGRGKKLELVEQLYYYDNGGLKAKFTYRNSETPGS